MYTWQFVKANSIAEKNGWAKVKLFFQLHFYYLVCFNAKFL